MYMYLSFFFGGGFSSFSLLLPFLSSISANAFPISSIFYVFVLALFFFLQNGSHISDHTSVCSLLIDTERTLALLQGLRAAFMVQSLPVLPEEEESEKWLSMEIFSSGLELQPFLDRAHAVVSESNDIGGKRQMLKHQGSMDTLRSFVHGLVNNNCHDERVALFLTLIRAYCQQKNMVIPLAEQNPDHPVARFARLFLVALLKLHDLIETAVTLVDQESTVSKELKSPVHLPAAIADICKLVHDAKMLLVKAHQESACSYEEICLPAIDRCLFLIEYIRSPVINVMNILHRQQVTNLKSRWHRLAKKALNWQRQEAQKDRQGQLADGTCVSGAVDSVKEILYHREHSKDQRQLAALHEVPCLVHVHVPVCVLLHVWCPCTCRYTCNITCT